MSDLIDRIEEAIRRIARGDAPMRIPVNQTDLDVVLRDCADRIAELGRENAELRSEINNLPSTYDEPVQRLGKRLAELLDEDHWLEVDPILHQIGSTMTKLRRDAERSKEVIARLYRRAPPSTSRGEYRAAYSDALCDVRGAIDAAMKEVKP